MNTTEETYRVDGLGVENFHKIPFSSVPTEKDEKVQTNQPNLDCHGEEYLDPFFFFRFTNSNSINL